MDTQTLTLSIKRILSTEGGGCIFNGETARGEKVRVKASYKVVNGPLAQGHLLQVAGTFRIDPEHGRQFHAEEVLPVRPKRPGERFLRNYLIKSPELRGIGLGEQKVNDLLRAFPGTLLEILNSGNIEELTKVINEPIAEALVARWEWNSGETEVVSWLVRHKIEVRVASKILRVWGSGAIEHLEADPYKLLAFLPWAKVDRLARHFGVENRDPRRLLGAVEWALYRRIDKKHTLTSPKDLVGLVRSALSASMRAAEEALEVARGMGVLVESPEGGFQHCGIARLEGQIRQRLLAMLSGEAGSQISLLAHGLTAEDIEAGMADVEAELGFPLNKEQRRAVALGVREPVAVLCGGAGTDKTTVLRAIHKILERFNIPIYQMALAGRAAERMRESTGREAFTITGFCMKSKAGTLEVPDDALLIVDEASMTDLATMYRLLLYLPKGGRLLMVGDPYQLPPISFGLIFDRLVESEQIPTVELRQVHRQDEASGIPAVAGAIRRQRIPTLRPFEGLGRGVSFIECPRSEIVEKVSGVFAALGGDLGEVRILGAVKGHPGGVVEINDRFQESLVGERRFCGDSWWKRWWFAPGDPVIYLKNDYGRCIWNGSLGTITELREERAGWVASVLWDDGESRDIPEVDFPRMALAYAMTIHKTQGSQFKRVIISVVEAGDFFDNSMLYTALTRGVEQVVLVGDRKVFERAVTSEPNAHKREVGFRI